MFIVSRQSRHFSSIERRSARSTDRISPSLPSPIMEVGKTLRVTTRKAWRNWLEKNHERKKEIWLVYPLRHTGERRVLLLSEDDGGK
jgi:hypothetical protein